MDVSYRPKADRHEKRLGTRDPGQRILDFREITEYQIEPSEAGKA
jgi:hypothetical protein